MTNLDIEQFNPKLAELQALAETSKALDLTDIKEVCQTRIQLKNARVEITKTGKAMRDDANKFATAVIAREKELIGIIKPEEERLSEAEEAAKQTKERESRKGLLPHRIERLTAIGDGIVVSEDELLEMDGPVFEAYINRRLAQKNEADRLEIERVKAEQEKEAQRLANEEATQKREEQACQDERERIERDQAAEKERQEKAKVDEDRRKEEEAEKDAAAEVARQKQLEADARYQEWLKSHDYQGEGQGLLLKDMGDHVLLYKFVDRFTK